jgi:hypothetical protein
MMEQNNSTSILKRNVMTRVRTVHIARRVFSTTTFSVGVFILAMWGIGREVWVGRVLQNEPSFMNVSAFVHFYLSAFLDTRFIVQALSIVALGALVWLGYSAVKNLQSTSGARQFAM